MRAELAGRVAPLAEEVLKLHRDVQGGPGLTRETAWVLLCKEMTAVSQEYVILRQLGLGRGMSQALVCEDGKYYDCHTFLYSPAEGKEYTFEIWFDITAYFRHNFGRAE